MNLENAKSNICVAIGMIEGTKGTAVSVAVNLLNGALSALEISAHDDDKIEKTCINCGTTPCPNEHINPNNPPELCCYFSFWTPKPRPPIAPTTATDAAVLGVEFQTEQDAPAVALPLDILTELHHILPKLSALIAQEQNDKLNDKLCDAFDAVDAAHTEAVELAHEEFASDTVPPNAPKVPMDFNG